MIKEESQPVEQPKKQSRKSWLRRPRFQYSISTLLLLTAILALWLGYVTNRARKQREAVAALTATGAFIGYDWEYDDDGEYLLGAKPPGPEWLRQLIGEEYFQEVFGVWFTKPSNSGEDSLETLHSTASEKDEPILTEEHLNYLKALPQLSSLSIHDCCPFSHPDFWKAVGNIKRFDLYDSCNMSEYGYGDQELRGIGSLKELTYLELESMGVTTGSLEEIGKLPKLETLILATVEFNDEDLVYLKNQKTLRSLRLSSCAVEGHGLKCLPVGLEHLEINGLSKLSNDTALENLQHLKSLKTLQLEDGGDLTDVTLRAMGRLCSLREVVISGHDKFEGDLESLKYLENLNRLFLPQTDLSAQDVEKLGCLPNLTQLSMSCYEIADEDMRCFEKLKSVRHLVLFDCKNNVNGLMHLKKMPKLKELEIYIFGSGTVSKAEQNRIEKSMPGVKISWEL